MMINAKKKCAVCSGEENLLCQICFAQKQEHQTDQQESAKLDTHLHSVLGSGIQYHENSVSSLIKGMATSTNVQNRIRNLKEKIAEAKQAILRQKKNKSVLEQIVKREQSLLQTVSGAQVDGISDEINIKKFEEQYDSVKLWYEVMLNKNQQIANKVTYQRQKAMKVIERLFKVFKIQDKKFILQKYIRIDKTSNILYANEEFTENGIPFVKVENQEILCMADLGAVEDEKEKQQLEFKIGLIILYGTKMADLIHKTFLPQVNLPYKVVVSREGIYMDNAELSISFLLDPEKEKFSNEKFCKFMTRLQANVQFLAWSIGYSVRPLLILDELFLKKLKENKYSTAGVRENGWTSKLRELKESEIIEEEEVMYKGFQKDQQIQAKGQKQKEEEEEIEKNNKQSEEMDEDIEFNVPQSLAPIMSCEQSAQSKSRKSSSHSEDEEFQVLE